MLGSCFHVFTTSRIETWKLSALTELQSESADIQFLVVVHAEYSQFVSCYPPSLLRHYPCVILPFHL